MQRFILNKVQQANGDHEVHNASTGCTYMPLLTNQTDLGLHPTCKEAVSRAKLGFTHLKRINGCYYCCNTCHTT